MSFPFPFLFSSSQCNSRVIGYTGNGRSRFGKAGFVEQQQQFLIFAQFLPDRIKVREREDVILLLLLCTFAKVFNGFWILSLQTGLGLFFSGTRRQTEKQTDRLTDWNGDKHFLWKGVQLSQQCWIIDFNNVLLQIYYIFTLSKTPRKKGTKLHF